VHSLEHAGCENYLKRYPNTPFSPAVGHSEKGQLPADARNLRAENLKSPFKSRSNIRDLNAKTQ
jgi:hypothetical protein